MSAADELEAEGEALEGQLELLDPYTRAAVEFFDGMGNHARLVRLAAREILVRGLPRNVCHVYEVGANVVTLATLRPGLAYPHRPSRVVLATIQKDGERWYVGDGNPRQRVNHCGYSTFPAAFTAALSVLGYSAQGIPK